MLESAPSSLYTTAMENLPSGTVTFLFTDIEGSTRLSQQYPKDMPALLARHHEILHKSIKRYNGYLFEIIGDALYSAFHSATDALNAAIDAQRQLQTEAWSPAPVKVRMGIHTGTAYLNETQAPTVYSGYATLALTQRITSSGHGGQIILSGATRELIRDSLPADSELLYLGEKRLKDLLRPEHLYQLNASGLAANFPPLRTLDSFQHNLPLQLTTFIGREHEMIEIKHELELHRLVTLTGSGGTGKTRLSLQVAAELLEKFDHGIWFVELAPLTDPDLIPQIIVTAIGISEQAGKPPLELLKEYLHERQALIVLDNCEHLIEACAKVVNELLNTAPNLKILASSREALGVKGEASYPVPTLSLPDMKHLPVMEQLSQYEAVRLFIDRALLVAPHFVVDKENAPFIAQICCRLDGIPLALELAAARVKMLSVEQISKRLDDRFHLLTGGARTALPRQQTLRALIDWSYDILSESERLLLCRLSIFAGGWTLEAAEEICAGQNGTPYSESISAYDVLDSLTQLVNKSLVDVVEQPHDRKTRYRMLETIRQYAREKLLEAGGGETIRQKHLAYFVDLAERAEPNLRSFDMITWLDRLEAELDNIRTALERAAKSEIEAQLRLSSALLWFWHIRGHKREGIDWLEHELAIEAAERGDRPLLPERAVIRGKALNAAGFLLRMIRNDKKSIERSKEALAIFQQLGSRGNLGMGNALLNLADMAGYQGDLKRAGALAEESLQLLRETADKFSIAQCLDFLAWLKWAEGDSNEVKALLEEDLSLRKDIGDKDGIAQVLSRLARLVFLQGDLSQSIALYEESLALFREVGNEWVRGLILADLARVVQAQGDYGKATQILEEALALGRDLGDKYLISQWLYSLGGVAQSQGDYVRATRMYQESLIMSREIDNPDIMANNLSALGNVALAQGDYGQATQQFDAELEIGQAKKIHWISASALSNLGRIAWARGNFELARQKLEDALAIIHEAGGKLRIGFALYCLGRVFQSQRDYASAQAQYRKALALARELGQRDEIASNLEALATLYVAQTQMELSPMRLKILRRATCLFSTAETLHPSLRFEMSAAERVDHDQAVAATRAALNDEAFATAWEEGKQMNLEEAIAYALKEKESGE